MVVAILAFHLLINNQQGAKELLSLQSGGAYFDKSAILADDRVDAPFPLQLLAHPEYAPSVTIVLLKDGSRSYVMDDASMKSIQDKKTTDATALLNRTALIQALQAKVKAGTAGSDDIIQLYKSEHNL